MTAFGGHCQGRHPELRGFDFCVQLERGMSFRLHARGGSYPSFPARSLSVADASLTARSLDLSVVWRLGKYPWQVGAELDLEPRRWETRLHAIRLGLDVYANIRRQPRLDSGDIGRHLADDVIPPTVEVGAICVAVVLNNLGGSDRIDAQ